MAYFIKNSSAGNTYFTAAGAAIGANNQPNVQGAAFAGIRDASLGDSTNDIGIISTVPYEAYTGYDDTSILMGVANLIQGANNNTIRSQGSSRGRESIHKVEAVRVVKYATAIRNHQWNEYSGTWSVAPSVANDLSAIGTDDEANSSAAVPGAFAFSMGGTVTQENYPARTQ